MSAPQLNSTSAFPNWFLVVVTVPVSVSILYFGRDFLIPLAIALLLFILTSAFVDRIDRTSIAGWTPPRWLAHLVAIAAVLLGLSTLAVIISNEAEEFAGSLPAYSERFAAMLARIEEVLGKNIVAALERSINEINAGNWLAGLANEASGFLASFMLVMLYLLFLFADRNAFAKKLPLIANDEETAQRFSAIVDSISNNVKQYMWINAVTSAMSGTVAYLIFWSVGLDFAAALALIVFLVGFIPNIGAFVGIALPSMLALLQFDNLTPFFIILFGYGAADQFIANVIQPSMQGKSLNLSIFMVMLSLSFWTMVWGGVGAFLAVPMMVIAIIVCAEIKPLRPIAILLSGDGRPGGA